jgi:RimJ/RimL family protein N-acetyltransferase
MNIRPIIEDDLHLRVEWMNNPKVYSSMKITLPITLDSTRTWFENNLGNKKRVDVVFENDERQVIAFGGITNIDTDVHKAETYIFVNPLLQGMGFGKDAQRLLCQYAFNTLHLHKLYIYTNRSNIASQKMHEALGYKLEGILRDEIIRGGIYEDRYYYGLLASDVNSSK